MIEFEPKNVFRNPIQIGMVVDDLEGTLKHFETILGMGPFTIVDFPPGGENVKMMYKGKPEPFTAKFCFFNLGNIEIEVIQPLTGKTIWRDFLDEKGPGLHHIKFSIPEHEPAQTYLEGKGLNISQMGASVGKNTGKEWVYYNTEDKVGFAIELMNEIVK